MNAEWTPLGYMLKRVASAPAWLADPRVRDICSVSGCISEPFTDYVRHWRHNSHWLFDSPEAALEVAALESVDPAGHTLFYYEAWPEEYDEAEARWRPLRPPAELRVHVLPPRDAQLLGYDVVTWSTGTSAECSPLSCNGLAAGLPVNAHCLFDRAEDAAAALDAHAFDRSEPGPFRIVAVHELG